MASSKQNEDITACAFTGKDLESECRVEFMARRQAPEESGLTTW
jgi:hypothetical protein